MNEDFKNLSLLYGPKPLFDEDDKNEKTWFNNLNFDDYKNDIKTSDFFNKYNEEETNIGKLKLIENYLISEQKDDSEKFSYEALINKLDKEEFESFLKSLNKEVKKYYPDIKF